MTETPERDDLTIGRVRRDTPVGVRGADAPLGIGAEFCVKVRVQGTYSLGTSLLVNVTMLHVD